MSEIGNYEDRYVAFLDILGFRNLINDLAKGEKPYTFVLDLLRKIHKPPQPFNPVSIAKPDGEFRAQSISDAVALSAAANPEGLDHMFFSVSELAIRLVTEGIFIRGAITRGRLYHDDTTVFGEGLVRAYHVESQIARYPRILITSDVIENVRAYSKNSPWDQHFNDIFKQADDGPMYLNILQQMCLLLESKEKMHQKQRTREIAQAQKIRSVIQYEFDHSFDDPKVFEKVQWFAQYWNNTIPHTVMELEPIEGPAVTRQGWKT